MQRRELIAGLVSTIAAAPVFGLRLASAQQAEKVRRPGVLMTLLVLPLYLPPLIFGTAAVEASLAAEGAHAHLLLLTALTLATLPLAPFAGAAALRQALD